MKESKGDPSTPTQKCGATAQNASQPTRRATQETRAPNGRKAKRRRAGRRSATKPRNPHQRKQRGEKRSRRDSHPDPHHQSNVHTKPRGGERPSAPQRGHDSTPQTSGRSHYFKLRDQATTSIQLSKVPPAGVEPATIRLRVGCSDHLSYGGMSLLRAPGGTRTRNIPHRKRELYPLSYGSKHAI